MNKSWRMVTWSALTLGCVGYFGSFPLVVETQAPAQQAQAPMGQPGQPGQEQGRGAQGRGGRGGLGGPGATDAANAEADFTKQPPVLPLPAAEQQKQFVLQPGYRIAPVLTDPDIKEPGAIAFDGNGRMFVLELRG